MAKIKLVVSATIEETFSDFIISKKTKGLAEKTLQSYQAQFQAVAWHLDVKMDIAMLQKADLDAMIISMRTAHLSPNSINSYTRTLNSVFSWCNEQGHYPPQYPALQGGGNCERNLFGFRTVRITKKSRHSESNLCRISGLGDYQLFIELRQPSHDS